MVSPRSGGTALPATALPRARLLLVALLACVVVACLVMGTAPSSHRASSQYLTTSFDEHTLWPSPTAEDYRVLRAIPVSRPRQYSKLRIVFEFPWINGLTNMEFSAVSAFLVAKSMGAEVLMPRGQVRSSLNLNEQNKTVVPTRDVWDVDKIKEMWGKVGLVVHEGGTKLGDNVYEIALATVNKLHRVEDFRDLVFDLLDKAVEKKPIPPTTKTVHIAFGNTLFKIDATKCPNEMFAASVMLPFAPRFVQLGRTALRTLKTYGYSSFNGVHLKLEEDSLFRAKNTGGFEGLLDVYSRALSAMDLNSSLPLYVASGIASSAGPEWERTKKVLLAGHAGKIITLTSLVPGIDTQGIPCEQLAMTDMLMLAASEKYVGINYSTFSIFAAILRARLGHTSDSAALIKLEKDPHNLLMQLTRDATFMTEIREMVL